MLLNTILGAFTALTTLTTSVFAQPPHHHRHGEHPPHHHMHPMHGDHPPHSGMEGQEFDGIRPHAGRHPGHRFGENGEGIMPHHRFGPNHDRSEPAQRNNEKQAMNSNENYVKISVQGNYRIIDSNGIPNHEIVKTGPNTISAKNYHAILPAQPQLAAQKTSTENAMGGEAKIGYAINGIPLSNPYNRNHEDAVVKNGMDPYGGHIDGQGVYHYHNLQVAKVFPELVGQEHTTVGYARDGFEIKNNYQGTGAALDECNGHDHDGLGYHYHITENNFPYNPICFSGVVNINQGNE